MTTFFLNDVLPQKSDRDIQAAFEQMVCMTTLLAKKPDLKLTRPIITAVPPNSIIICGITLSRLIESCANRDVRTAAQFLFTQNLIASHENALSEKDQEELLEKGYKFQGEDAINLMIAHRMSWPLLSIPLAEYLEHDTLDILNEGGNTISAINYYAQEDISFIERWLFEKANQGADGLTRFKGLFEKHGITITPSFEKNWNNAPVELQQIAFERFKAALRKDMLFPIRKDDDLIKKCEVKRNVSVYELRQLGSGLRIYFGYQDDGSIIMAGLHTKAESDGKEQTADINKAAREISKAKMLALR